VDVVFKGRHMEVSERFRTLAQERLAKVERLDPGMQRVDVEVAKEANPRLADRAYRVQLTCRSRGPVIRAEAAAEDKVVALDLAWGRLESRLRRAADRRSDWKKREKSSIPAVNGTSKPDSSPADLAVEDQLSPEIGSTVHVDGPMVVREKTHAAPPMSLDQALYEMELVGHDFFLFVDHDSRRPSVVYRRRAYDYGVIRLDVASAEG
jgi:ribosomal subunit interface protein